MTSTAPDVEKVARGERARIEQLVASMEPRVRRAFRQFLDVVRSDAVRREVRQALEAGGVEAALRVADQYAVILGDPLYRMFLDAAEQEVAALAAQVRRATRHAAIALSFDPSYPRAAEIMRGNRLEFVRGFTAAQRQATRAALVEALQSGLGPVATARAFRDSIGLTEAQRLAVANYRRILETGDAAALERALRDRRFDPSVRRLLEDGDPLGARRIARMVERYRTRYLQYRAETIARTEALRTVNAARAEALAQVTERADIPPDAVTRTWRSTRDARVRDTHMWMDGQKRGMDEPFVSPRGARLMYPGDASLGAPGSEIVNCRCVVMTSVKV